MNKAKKKNYRKMRIFFSPYRGMGYLIAYDVTKKEVKERIRLSQYDKYDDMCMVLANRYRDAYTIVFK